MRLSGTFLRWLFAGLLVAGIGFIGCDDDNDSASGGDLDSVVGVWQRTQANVEQETIQIAADGTWEMVFADYVAEACFTGSGTYAVEDDSLVIVDTGDTTRVAWSRSGSSLTVADPEDASITVYASVASLPTCESYGFGGGNPGLWSGTMTASVDGAAMNFGEYIYGAVDNGMVVFGGNGGTRQIQFAILGQAAGNYDLGSGSMGIYVPDTNNPTTMLTTVAGLASGTANFSTLSSTRIVGTFSFSAINASTMETVSITNGVVDISAN